MPIWSAASVNNQPQVQLTNWTIKKMKEGNFFIGDEVGMRGSGRVSTAIVTYDETTKKGVTQSGRVYELLGNEGHSSDGEYVWGRYKVYNKLTELDDGQPQE